MNVTEIFYNILISIEFDKYISEIHQNISNRFLFCYYFLLSFALFQKSV